MFKFVCLLMTSCTYCWARIPGCSISELERRYFRYKPRCLSNGSWYFPGSEKHRTRTFDFYSLRQSSDGCRIYESILIFGLTISRVVSCMPRGPTSCISKHFLSRNHPRSMSKLSVWLFICIPLNRELAILTSSAITP